MSSVANNNVLPVYKVNYTETNKLLNKQSTSTNTIIAKVQSIAYKALALIVGFAETLRNFVGSAYNYAVAFPVNFISNKQAKPLTSTSSEVAESTPATDAPADVVELKHEENNNTDVVVTNDDAPLPSAEAEEAAAAVVVDQAANGDVKVELLLKRSSIRKLQDDTMIFVQSQGLDKKAQAAKDTLASFGSSFVSGCRNSWNRAFTVVEQPIVID